MWRLLTNKILKINERGRSKRERVATAEGGAQNIPTRGWVCRKSRCVLVRGGPPWIACPKPTSARALEPITSDWRERSDVDRELVWREERGHALAGPRRPLPGPGPGTQEDGPRRPLPGSGPGTQEAGPIYLQGSSWLQWVVTVWLSPN